MWSSEGNTRLLKLVGREKGELSDGMVECYDVRYYDMAELLLE